MAEQRVLFASGQDVDFSIVPAELGALLVEFKDLPEVRELVGRGVRVLVDKIGMSQEIKTVEPPAPNSSLLSPAEYVELSNRFWYQAVVAAKKWRRGELWVAMSACEGTLTASTIDLARWRTKLLQPAVDTWHGSRFIEEWMDPAVLAALAEARTGYGRPEIARSLQRLATLFARLESECCSTADYEHAVDTPRLIGLLDDLLAPN
jgi:aminoglycoside 6-adenylyltransferase